VARILIVEDDSTIRQSVEFALRRAGFEVQSLETGVGAPKLIAKFQPDLVVLDIMLPGMTGFEIAEAIREKDSETAIIMMSALSSDDDMVAGLALGADDYVGKPFSMEVLLARIQANLRRIRARELLKKDAIIQVGDLIIDPQSFRVTVAGKPVVLRTKEFQLLYTLALNHNRLSTRNALAEKVWGYKHLPSSRTIDVHIRRLRSTIEEVSEYTYIHTVHGMGYRFVPVKKDERGHHASQKQ
jgi:DNA-binding response OmpR family regulator